jgi:hypothetical protein
VTVTVAVALSTKPHPFETRTHSVVVDDGVTVIGFPERIGDDVLPLDPEYHW